MVTDLDPLKYPIGHFECPDNITAGHIAEWINDLAEFPQRLSALVNDLSDEQLDTPYRPGGWTVRQLVHHLADSHHHCYTRFKWALTEKRPIIKAYEEKDWAGLFDARTAPIHLSLTYLEGLHAKMEFLLTGLGESDFRKVYIPPKRQCSGFRSGAYGKICMAWPPSLCPYQGTVAKGRLGAKKWLRMKVQVQVRAQIQESSSMAKI